MLELEEGQINNEVQFAERIGCQQFLYLSNVSRSQDLLRSQPAHFALLILSNNIKLSYAFHFQNECIRYEINANVQILAFQLTVFYYAIANMITLKHLFNLKLYQHLSINYTILAIHFIKANKQMITTTQTNKICSNQDSPSKNETPEKNKPKKTLKFQLDSQSNQIKKSTRFNRIKSQTQQAADIISKSIDKQQRNDKRLKSFRKRKVMSIAKTKTTHRRNKSLDNSNGSINKTQNMPADLSKTTHEINIFQNRNEKTRVNKMGQKSRKMSIHFESSQTQSGNNKKIEIYNRSTEQSQHFPTIRKINVEMLQTFCSKKKLNFRNHEQQQIKPQWIESFR